MVIVENAMLAAQENPASVAQGPIISVANARRAGLDRVNAPSHPCDGQKHHRLRDARLSRMDKNESRIRGLRRGRRWSNFHQARHGRRIERTSRRRTNTSRLSQPWPSHHLAFEFSAFLLGQHIEGGPGCYAAGDGFLLSVHFSSGQSAVAAGRK